MRRCKRSWEVDALREGRLTAADAESFARHRRACEECDGRFSADERLRSLGRGLSAPTPSEMHVRRLRAEILRHAAASERPSPRRLAWAALALAAIAFLSFAFLRPPRVASPGATAFLPGAKVDLGYAAAVVARPGTAWTQRREGGVERVHLDEGALRIQVRHQGAGERFFVDLPDGEIEVRGTRFEVVVGAGRTVSVDVSEGVVALRRFGDREIVLAAGEGWPKPLAVESLPRASAAARPSATRLPSAVKPVATGDGSPDYARAMDRYRAGDYVEAERAFHAFSLAHPDAPEAEDARFLEATSLARGGRTDAAALLAQRFLDRHPASFHAKDAAILVARAARDRGDCAKARAVLSSWSIPATQEVTAALGACGRDPSANDSSAKEGDSK